MKLFTHEVRKVTAWFLKRSPVDSGGPKNSQKMDQKWGFWGFCKNLVNLYAFFLFEYKSTIGILTFCHMSAEKLHVWEKSDPWIMPKNQLVELRCCIFECGNNKFIQSFQEVVIRHAWTCPKLCQVVSQLYFKNELRFSFCFCMWLDIHRSYKFVQPFQLGVVRHLQSD